MQSRISKPVIYLIQCAIFLILVLFYMVEVQEAQYIDDTRPKVAKNREILYVPHLKVIELLSLNYKQAAADILWLRMIQYFATHLLYDKKYEWMDLFVEQAIALDPRFYKVYLWAAGSLLYGQQINNQNIMKSNMIYQKALRYFPNDYEIPYRLGMNYYSELKARNPEEKKNFQNIGLSYFERAANSPHAQPDIFQLIRGIAKTMGREEVLLYYLFDELLAEKDPIRKEALASRIAELQSKLENSGELQQMMEKAKIEEEKRKSDMPYLNSLIYEIISQQELD